jgi:hypothetical protein
MAVEIRVNLMRYFYGTEILLQCIEDPPCSRVKGWLLYAAWRSAHLMRCRGYTIVHGSKFGSFALTAMRTGGGSARFTP